MNAALLLEIIRRRRTGVLLAFFTVVTALGLTSYRLAWQQPRLESLRTEWSAKRDLSGGGTRNPVEVYRQGKADLAAVQQRMPQRKEFVRLLGDLYELASNNRLTLGSVTYKLQSVKDAKDSSLLPYELTLATAGSYASLKSFVSDIERMDEMMVIDGLLVTAGKETGGQTVDAKIVLTAYFKAEGA